MSRHAALLDAPDLLAPTPGGLLADALGDRYPDVFAAATGVPLWADEAPLARVQKRWERYARQNVLARRCVTCGALPGASCRSTFPGETAPAGSHPARVERAAELAGRD